MASRRHPMFVALATLGALVVIGAAGGLWWWASRRAEENKPERFSGAVEAGQYQVAPATMGRVVEVMVREGETVKSGAPVVRLDDTAPKLQVDQANEGVNAASASVKQAEEKKGDDRKEAEIAEAKARLKQAEAAVALAKVQLSYTTITAPHDGIVTTITTNVGQNAAPARTLLTISDPQDLYARVYVPQPRLGTVKVGGPAKVRADGVPDSGGTVEFVSSKAEFTPNNVDTKEQRSKLVYEVRVRITTTDGTYKPGQPVDVTFP